MEGQAPDQEFLTARNLVQKHQGITRSAATALLQSYSPHQVARILEAGAEGTDERLIGPQIKAAIAVNAAELAEAAKREAEEAMGANVQRADDVQRQALEPAADEETGSEEQPADEPTEEDQTPSTQQPAPEAGTWEEPPQSRRKKKPAPAADTAPAVADAGSDEPTEDEA